MVRVSLAGGIGIRSRGVTIGEQELRGRHVRLVLALFILERGRALTRHDVADALWGEEELPRTWESTVRTALVRARRFLDPLAEVSGVAIAREGEHYRLVLPARATVDVEEAADLVPMAEAHLAAGDASAARAAAAQAEAILARPLLPGIDGAWIERARDRLGDLWLRAIETLAEAALDLGDATECLAAVERALERAPFRESLHRLVMRAHWAVGNRGEALQAYEACRRLLAEEMGVDPSPATEALYVRLLGEPLVESAPGDHAPATLGRPPTRLVGRATDLDRVEHLLREARAITVTGTGGVGKTALVRAVVARRGGDTTTALHWVELAPVLPDAVAHAIGHVIGGARAGIDPLRAALSELGERPALVVLDSCEHVLDEAAAAVSALLAECPNVRVLATSRAPLAVEGEHLYVLDPLPVPQPADDPDAIAATAAVELFLMRARELGADIQPTPADAAAMATICQRLDGLPLALELAAARARVMSPGQIARRLDQRFRLLQHRHIPADPRHRSLLETLAWSYDTLDPGPQRAFRRLSVFAGSFSLDAAGTIAGDPDEPLDDLELLDLLTDLVEQSMVVALASRDDEPRYQVLETLREYGALRLAEDPEGAFPAQRHTSWFLALAEAADTGLRGPEEQRWVQALDADLPNVLAAFHRVNEAGDVDRALRFTVALFDFAFYRMRLDVADHANAAVALPGADDHPLFGQASAVAGYLAWERGLLETSIAHLDRAAGHGRDWWTLDAGATVALFQGRLDDSVAGYGHAVEEAERLGNSYLRAITLSQQSFAHMLAGRGDQLELAQRSEAAARLAGAPTAQAQAAWALGLAQFDDDPAQALACLERCVALASQVGNKLSAGAAADPAEALRTKMTHRERVDDVAAAIAKLEYWVDQGNPPNVWVGLRRLIRQFAGMGLLEEAALLAGAEAAAPLKIPPRQRERERHDVVLARVRAELGDREYERLATEGAGLDQEGLLAELRRANAIAMTLPMQPAGGA